MEPLINYGFVAANVYFSGTCNLQCTYCYQPRFGKQTKASNDKIIEWISSGKMEEDIEKYIGKNIESLNLWGGEPTLNLPYLIERLDSIYERFPKLNNIFFSTNLAKEISVRNIKSYLDKLKELNEKSDRKIVAGIQFSLDGPPEINDKSRTGSNTLQTIDNVTELLKYTKNYPHDLLSFNFKGTHSGETLEWMIQPHETYETNLEYYYRFFDNQLAEWKRKRYILPDGFGEINLVYPGQYTQKDGFIYKKIIETLHSQEWKNKGWKVLHDFPTQTTRRIEDTFKNLRSAVHRSYKGELLSHCTCSAGRSCAGLRYDGTYHMCHTAYVFDDYVLKYLKENNITSNFEESFGYNFENYDKFLKDIEVASYEDDLKLSRTLSNMEYFWKNISLRLQYLRMQVDTLAQSGQISSIYLIDKWADLATAFLLFGGNECPADNLWEFGSLFIRSNSHLKLIFNGVFEFVMNYMDENGDYI